MVVPLGVARVLIADMAGMGLVTVHGGASKDNEAPDLALLERVLSGLRRLLMKGVERRRRQNRRRARAFRPKS